jgi:hypothetical protein
MLDERYSIEVGDDVVEIHGYLTIEEAFDFLNFFEKKGFINVAPGQQNSTFRMIRENEDHRRAARLKEQREEEDETYKFLLNKELERHNQTKVKLQELESLIRGLCIPIGSDPKNAKVTVSPCIDTSRIFADPLEIPSVEES